MKVTEETIRGLSSFLIEQQEADIITCLANRLCLSPGEAMNLYYSSEWAARIEEGLCGIQHLAPEYLADEIIACRQGRGRAS